MTEIVNFELRDEVALVRMDDGKANAMAAPLLDGINRALDRALAEAKAVVLMGRQGRFSAGFDLKIMMSSPEAARSLVMHGGEVLMRLYEHPQPLVVACTGHAIAGGVLMAATGDIRLGIPGDFKLGLNEVGNGMPVPILAHEIARDRLDPRFFVEAVLFARLWDPEQAVRVGWLDRLVPEGELEARCIEEAKALAKLPKSAFAATKRSIRRQTITYIRDTLAMNLAEFNLGG